MANHPKLWTPLKMYIVHLIYVYNAPNLYIVALEMANHPKLWTPLNIYIVCLVYVLYMYIMQLKSVYSGPGNGKSSQALDPAQYPYSLSCVCI